MAAKPLAAVVRYLHRVVGSGAAEPSDADLLAFFAEQREPAAFETLVRRHGPLVLGVCRRVLGSGPDVDDALQATFLVLARKAGAIRQRDSLGSWLHGVAFNMSQKLRKKRAIRQRRESGLESTEPSMPMTTDPMHQASLRELGAVLDEELQRLPAVCRAAIVACHLEGLSTAEAAHQLGVPASTLKSRLQRGRDLLRKRLERRGVGLSAAGLVVLLVEQSRAALTSAVVRTTVEAAVSFAASGTGAVSSQAAALALKALKTSALGKIKLVVFGVLTFGLLGFGAAAVPTRTAAPPLQTGKMFTRLAQKDDKGPVARDQQGDPLPAGAVARLGTLRWRHDGAVYFAAFLPDGKTVITAGEDRTVRVWDFPSGKEIRRLVPAPLNIKSDRKVFGMRYPWPVALSKDGKTIALGSSGVGTSLYDVQTMKELPGLDEAYAVQTNGTLATNRVLAFSPSGERLATMGLMSGRVRIWDCGTAKQVSAFGDPGPDGLVAGKLTTANAMAWTPDGKSLATVHQRDEGNTPVSVVKFWDPATGNEIRSMVIAGGSHDPWLAFSPDGKALVLSTYNRNTVVDVASGKEICKFTNDKVSPPNLVFSKDGARLYGCGVGPEPLVEYDALTGKVIRKIGSGLDPNVGLWEWVGAGRHVEEFIKMARNGDAGFGGFVGMVDSMALSPDGNAFVLTGARNHAPRFIDVQTGKQIAVTTGHVTPVLAVAFSPDGKTLLTQASDGFFKKWDGAAAKEIDSAAFAHSYLNSALSEDGKVGASWTRGPGGAITFVDALSGKVLGRTQEDMPETSASLRFTPDGKILAFRQRLEQKIELFNVPNAKLLHSIAIATGFNKLPGGNFNWRDEVALQTIIFSADGKLLASYANSNTMGIWSTTTGKAIASLNVSKNDGIPGGAFSPDGRSLALDLNDGTVELFEVATGQARRIYGKKGQRRTSTMPIVNFDRPFSDVLAGPRVAFAPDGKSLVYGDQDGTVRFWNISSGQEIASFKGHSASVNAVAFAASGKTVASASSDTTVLIWDATKVK